MDVRATEETLKHIDHLKRKYGQKLIFHQSGGCCDGSSPMCFPEEDFLVGERDVLLGEIGGIPFYIGRDQHDKWKNTNLIIDCVPGMGGMFSLDNGTGKRFLTKSEICLNEK